MVFTKSLIFINTNNTYKRPRVAFTDIANTTSTLIGVEGGEPQSGE